MFWMCSALIAVEGFEGLGPSPFSSLKVLCAAGGHLVVFLARIPLQLVRLSIGSIYFLVLHIG